MPVTVNVAAATRAWFPSPSDRRRELAELGFSVALAFLGVPAAIAALGSLAPLHAAVLVGLLPLGAIGLGIWLVNRSPIDGENDVELAPEDLQRVLDYVEACEAQSLAKNHLAQSGHGYPTYASVSGLLDAVQGAVHSSARRRLLLPDSAH